MAGIHSSSNTGIDTNTNLDSVNEHITNGDTDHTRIPIEDNF